MLSTHLVSRAVIVSLGLLLGAVVSGCQLQGNGVDASDARPLQGFRSVHVRAGLVAEIRPGPFSVVVEGDSNIVPHVLTTVHGETLDVEPDVSFEEAEPLRVLITAPEFDELFLEAGGRLDVFDVAEEDLSLRCRAGGDVFVSGEVDHLELTQSAGGNVHARDLEATDVTVNGSAGGEVELQATHAVEGLVESGSVVRVHGAPAIKKVSTASGGEVVYVE